jgi:menaquinone-9 beta-reductase
MPWPAGGSRRCRPSRWGPASGPRWSYRQRRCAREPRLTRRAQRRRPRVARASRSSSPRFARIVFANRENTARQSGRPCATYARDDTWTDAPFADGVVLIGDAAGHNDPIIGQWLSIALRDARIVRDVILDGARQSAAFVPYGEERASRMERVRFIADVLAVAQAEDADNRSARRAMLAEKMAAMDPEIFLLH